jgi:hypothetical protein
MILLGVNLVDLTSIATQSNYEWNEKGKKKKRNLSHRSTLRGVICLRKFANHLIFHFHCRFFVQSSFFWVLIATFLCFLHNWSLLFHRSGYDENCIYVLFNFKFINHFQLSYLQNISVLLLISCLICYFIIVTPVLFK